MRFGMKRKMLSALLAVTMLAMLLPIAPAPKAEADETEPETYTLEEVFGELLDTQGDLISYEGMYDTLIKSGKVSVVDIVYGGQLQKGLYADVDSLGNSLWSTQAIMSLLGEIHNGDVVFISYKIRGIESTDEANQVTVSDKIRPSPSRPGRSVGVDATVIADGEWNHIYGGVVATWDTEEGETPQFVIHMAYELQKLEITDIRIINFRQNIAVEQLPRMDQSVTYEGREPDAAWRAEAEQRIEQYRKSDVAVLVVDSNGNPVPGAEVAIAQKKHKYSFGSVMNFNVVDSNRPQEVKEQYLNLIKMTSNSSGDANNLKWQRIYEMEDNIERNLSWAEENGIKMRGHVLIWGQWNKPPQHLVPEMQSDPELLRQRTLEHITTAVTKYKGRLEAWDVVNEPLSSRDFTDVLGNEIMLEWFEAAHQADPDARLFLNDYGLLRNDIGHGNYTYDVLEYLINHGAPIHGVGMQGHFSGKQPVAPVTMLGILDRFAGLGLDIEVTEFTFDTEDEALQADFWRDALTVVFSHPSTTGFHTWGLWEGQMDKPSSAMFRTDFSPKPNGDVWMDLIYDQWWTNEAGVTDQNGEFATRAFLGEHEITVSANGREVAHRIALDEGGKELVVVLDAVSMELNRTGAAAGDTIEYTVSTPPHTETDIRFERAGGIAVHEAVVATDAAGRYSGSFVVPSEMTSGVLYGSATVGEDKAFANVVVYEDGEGYQPPAVIDSAETVVDAANPVLAVTKATKALGVPVDVSVPAGVTNAAIALTQLLQPPAAADDTVTTAELPALNIAAAATVGSTPGTVALSIPAGAAITAPLAWDGVLRAPSVKAAASAAVVPDAGKTAAVDVVIEVGADAVPLTFSKAVRLLIPGMGGKEAGFVRDGVFTKITGTLSEDSQLAAEAEIPAGGDAAMTVGDDLVVWTKHFTEFVAFTQQTVSSGGNRGGGMVYGGSAPIAEPKAAKEAGHEAGAEAAEPTSKPESKTGFTDIAGHWAATLIDGLAGLGIVAGYPDGSFGPDREITRAEFVKLLAVAFQLKAGAGNAFPDTAAHWARDAIASAYEAGIVGGYSDASFGPDDPITREQMAVMIAKATGLPAAAAEADFIDASELSDWAVEAVHAAKQSQILSGYPDGSFRPRAHATRAESAAILWKTLQYLHN